MKLLRALHFIVRMMLVMACAFWGIILCLILPPLFSEGLDGVHRKLSHMWTMGRFTFPWTCTDSIELVHQGYTNLIILLLATWTAVEVKRRLRQRMVTLSVRSVSTTPES